MTRTPRQNIVGTPISVQIIKGLSLTETVLENTDALIQSAADPALAGKALSDDKPAEGQDTLYIGNGTDVSSGTGTGEKLELPQTGITGKPGFAKPASVRYLPTRMELQIPSLNVSGNILSVERIDGTYPVEWLGMDLGLLADTALPGRGNAVIAAHNTVSSDEYGPFALIAELEPGDRFFVRDDANQILIFEVYSNEKIGAYDFDALFGIAGQYDSTVTLLTCEDERAEGGYASRRIVSAKQIG